MNKAKSTVSSPLKYLKQSSLMNKVKSNVKIAKF